MPDVSTILSLPLILPAQAQKHVTHNEALRLLDVAVQLAVLNRDQTVPPALAAVGDRHIVAAGAVGLWAGQAGRIALFTAEGWQFFAPLAGWQAHVLAEGQTAVFDGLDWTVPGSGPLAPTMLGVNTTADAVNRLAVSSPATLLTHEGAGHQLKVNKAAAGDTASLMYQTGFSGRAEMGLAGSDDFSIKVSADGAVFATALTVNRASGIVALPQGVSSGGLVLRDGVDATKGAQFTLSGLSTGVTRSYALPNTSSEIAVLAGTQAFTGDKSFSGAVGVSGALTASGVTTVSGVFTVSNAVATLGTATGVATYGVGTGATGSGSSKTLNLGTGGASGSTTVVNIGSATAGALGSLVVNVPTVTFAAGVTAVAMPQANLSALRLGLGGAVADATNRLSVNTPAVLLNHGGAGIEATLNKAAVGNDAALAFKTGFSTRAMLGLLASDGIALKVSPDGSSFVTALSADQTSGQVTLHQPAVLAGQAADPASPADGAIWHNASTGQIKAQVAGAARIIDSQQNVPWLTPAAGEYVLTTSGAGGTTTSTLAGAAGRIDLFPFIPRADITVNQAAVYVTTLIASALGKVVIYGADANGRPGSLIQETADMDFSTTGVKSATIAQTLRQGRTYWIGIRHSSTATLSAWPLTATPDLNGGVPVTSARKVLRRTLTYATAAPASWGFVASEISAAAATAIWLRMA
ncbi:DUF2793 domain-containing protein [Rhodobacter ferrooxidans]|uniref:DUF2793 domain-containing protein n=1 Tax=Rhodobacter ferrooxidans TaxID=371731 RepID=C8S3G9_9RHOB|nr:DUF2793 domain-containing protein [Rhodobacter sp. SW2]EEW24417.1 hypothetical protein Rsw2DRAFT_2597 [Rhodobacter sp. SW2]